ncbi:F-box/FBD/LRR-repeat protein At1g13570-like isoform X2 [Punica granatum]|uniref:F-box/FBD/LRR-repeat protein At1g13570-like isoform X2 n=2 Tax=Punica granatum TaxID=22663 RepID=A0A6P8EHQ6_PUNGR|nr:F-box/FBD/LRR-repeat protein At1g13570-like isoform X2 [Punica granatum]
MLGRARLLDFFLSPLQIPPVLIFPLNILGTSLFRSQSGVMAAGTERPSSKRNWARRRAGKPSLEGEDQDRISDLPVDLIERILCLLPLREAARTSILSRSWRYTWTALTELVFDEHCTPLPSRDKSIAERLVKIIDTVLLHHWGPIKKFVLSHGRFKGTSDIDRWIMHLSRMSVTDFTFHLEYNDPFCIPSCLFHCRHLVKLDLAHCSLKLPPAFEGFENLESLQLTAVNLTQDSLEKLISSCPQLSELDLLLADHITHLTIDAPNLKELAIYGDLGDINFGCNSLTRVEMGSFYMEYEHAQANEYHSNLEKFFTQLLLIRVLRIEEEGLKYLSVGKVPTVLPNPIVNLEIIVIKADLSCLRDALTTLCILRSSPNLEQIVFSLCSEHEVADEDEIEDCSEIYRSPSPLKALRFVSVCDSNNRPQEMSFLKFVLLNSPVLEKMEVHVSRAGPDMIRADKLLEKLEQFQRASAQAQIIVG